MLKYLFNLIYNVQVTLTFPVAMLKQFINYEWVLPKGYFLRSPDGLKYLNEWADLLNSDGHFGEWSPERIKTEILPHTITPDAASLLFHHETLIGCFCTSTTARSNTGLGMWFIIDSSYRGKRLPYPLCFRTLAYFARENYDKVFLTTDPFRLPAISFYLSHGAKPVYSALFSVFQWWKIRRQRQRFRKTKKNSADCTNGEGLRISEIREATDKEWDDIWAVCDYATYFHSREWAEIWQVYTNNSMRPCGRYVRFSDGKSVLLPFSLQKRRGLIKHYFLTAEGNFGNWISESILSEGHVALLTEYLIKRVGNLIWRWNPYDGCRINVNPDEIFKLVHDETYAVNLSKGYCSVLNECSHGHRCSARKAEREGITIKCADCEAEWQGYYAAYEDSLGRWGDSALSQFTWDLFYGIFKRNSINIKLWVAIYKGMVISGALCFYSKRHVVCWHAASVSEYFTLRPVNLLMLEIMKDSCEKGYAWFDFNTSSHIEGVSTFKKRFGAIELPCNVVYQKTNLTKAYIFSKECATKLFETHREADNKGGKLVRGENQERPRGRLENDD